MRKWLSSEKFWLAVIIVVQTIIYILAGVGKAYIHMDEAYSLGLAQYGKVDITANEDFYNHWHTKDYYQDYLAVQEDERWNWMPVYENQKNDVHPPLFYLLLRLAMEMSGEEFSKWPGIILNIIIAAVNTAVMYGAVRKLLDRDAKKKKTISEVEIKSLVLTAVASLTIAAVSAVVYIRMYMLLTLFVTLTVWLHLKLWESEKVSWKLLLAIGLTALGGVLTQYYYLFFLAPTWVVMAVKYVKEKKWKELGWYTGALVVAGMVSLVTWPWSIQHMFFGYRGQGVLVSLTNVPQLLSSIWQYVGILDYNAFHRTLAVWATCIVVLGVFCKLFSNSVSLSESNPSLRSGRDSDPAQPGNNSQITYKTHAAHLDMWSIVLWPTVVYFLIVAAVSPFIELRYIMPITGLAVVLVVSGVYEVARRAWPSRKWGDVVVGGMIGVMMAATPVQLMTGVMRIELLYRDKENLMQELEDNADVPILYFITTENNRFLDNILPFAAAEESYLALDVEPSEGKVQEILAGKDLSRGLYLFVSGAMNQEETVEAVIEATGLTEARWVRGVNTCEIYYLR